MKIPKDNKVKLKIFEVEEDMINYINNQEIEVVQIYLKSKFNTYSGVRRVVDEDFHLLYREKLQKIEI